MTTRLCALISAAVFIAMGAWTWEICPDPLVDFGRELYIPWRLTQGEHLYRDIAHFNGPLSQYFNAIMFKVFGASLLTIKFVNFAIAGCVLAMIFAIAKTLCDEWAALVAAVSFSIFFAFNQTTGNANFNWLTPYSHELTHGIALALAILCCLWRADSHGRTAWLITAGFLMGLILLTKAEVIVASLCGAATMLMQPSKDARVIFRRGTIFFLAMILPVLVAFTALALTSGAEIAGRGLLGSFSHLGNSKLLNMTYFRWIGGGADATKLREGGIWMILYSALIGAAWLTVRRRQLNRELIVIVSILASVAGYLIANFFWHHRIIERIAFLRPLPLVVIAMLVISLIQRRAPIERAMLILAGVLLIKIRYNVQPSHYGFALAMPAMIFAVILGQRAMKDSLGARGWIPRALLIGILAQPAWLFLRLDNNALESRNLPLGEVHNRFFADPARGVILHQVMQDLTRMTGPDQSLAVIPEGLLINFLTQRKLSVADTQWTPPAIAMFGENAMRESLNRNPPDWVVLAHADTSIYDARWFGIDYAVSIREWIDANYEVTQQYGATPFTSDKFGALLLKRRDAQ